MYASEMPQAPLHAKQNRVVHVFISHRSQESHPKALKYMSVSLPQCTVPDRFSNYYHKLILHVLLSIKIHCHCQMNINNLIDNAM